MSLTCSSCGNPIESPSRPDGLPITRCLRCDLLLCVGPLPDGPPTLRFGMKLVRADRERVVFVHRWFGFGAFALLFPIAIVGGWLVALLTNGDWHTEGAIGYAMLAGTSIGSLALLYLDAALFLNRTVVEVSEQGLERRRGPVPWPGGVAIPRAAIRAFQATIEEHRSGENDMRVVYTYAVVVRTADGRRIGLVERLEPVAALRLCAAFSRALAGS